MREFDRRELLRMSITGAAGLSSTGLLSGCTGRPEPSTDDSAVETGPQLPPRVPGSLRRASRAETEFELNVVAGQLPHDLRGHLFSVASLPDDGDAYVFNGDGMIQRLDFAADKVVLRCRIAKTPSYYADQATAHGENEFLDAGVLRLSPTLGARNQANHAVASFGDRLIVSCDTGRPYTIDPNSLQPITPLGANRQWRSAIDETLLSGPFPAVLTAAHPCYDAGTGELFSVNYAPVFPKGKAFTDLLRFNHNGSLQRWKIVDGEGRDVRIEQSVHQLAMTRDFVILADTAFRIGQAQIFGDHSRSPQSPDTPLYIIRRDALQENVDHVAAQRIVVPREMLHFLADYDNPDGRITLHVAHHCAWDISDWLQTDDRLGTVRQPVRRGLRGIPSTPLDIGVLGKHVIDTSAGTLVDSQLLEDHDFTWGATLPIVQGPPQANQIESLYWLSFGFSEEMLSWRTSLAYEDYKYRRVSYSELPILGRPSTLFRADTTQMKIADGYQFPPGRFATTAEFVPRDDAGDTAPAAGYLVCVVISDDVTTDGSSGDEFWIFDAANLKQGPVCRLGHSQLDVAFALHCTWLPKLPSPKNDNPIPIREDFAQRLTDQPEWVKDLFEREVFPKFEGSAK